MANVYFQLTESFNAERPVALLSSGQAVVHYRLAIMSKDGDWIVREEPEACARILAVLAERGARYRPGAPLAGRWLAGGWSSHFEYRDERARRIRCDFVSRPPRVSLEAVEAMFAQSAGRQERLQVVTLKALIALKQTQRAKDYAVIGELARRLQPHEELELTTDPDRILELAPRLGQASRRAPVQAAAQGRGRDAVIVELAREIDAMQRADKQRLETYRAAGARYLEAVSWPEIAKLSLAEQHRRLLGEAASWLPERPAAEDAPCSS